VERKNIEEEGKEGRWENQKKICFSSLTHTHLCLRHGAHTSRTFVAQKQTAAAKVVFVVSTASARNGSSIPRASMALYLYLYKI